MAQLVVRNLEESVKQRLQRRAARHARSMEEEVRDILRSAVSAEEAPLPPLGSRIKARFSRAGLDTEIAELRGQKARAVSFKK